MIVILLKRFKSLKYIKYKKNVNKFVFPIKLKNIKNGYFISKTWIRILSVVNFVIGNNKAY